MIGNRAQRLIGRAVVTTAIVAAIAILVLIYIRSGGNGTGAGTIALRASASRSGGSSEPSGQSTGSQAAGSGGPPTSSGEPSGGSAETAGPSAGASGPPLKSGTGGAAGTYTGPVIQTLYGPVQVAVAEQGGRIVDVKALQVPTEHQLSLYISERVTPLLREEALRAQSARINIVSGATFTSEGYAESLQSALSHVP